MLPDPVFIVDDGSIYAGVFLACIVAAPFIGFGLLMAHSSPIKGIRVGFSVVATLGLIGAWAGIAIDASQYSWFEWHDGLWFPFRILITPDYYTSVASLAGLVLPSIMLIGSLVTTLLNMIHVVRALEDTVPQTE